MKQKQPGVLQPIHKLRLMRQLDASLYWHDWMEYVELGGPTDRAGGGWWLLM